MKVSSPDARTKLAQTLDGSLTNQIDQGYPSYVSQLNQTLYITWYASKNDGVVPAENWEVLIEITKLDGTPFTISLPYVSTSSDIIRDIILPLAVKSINSISLNAV